MKINIPGCSCNAQLLNDERQQRTVKDDQYEKQLHFHVLIRIIIQKSVFVCYSFNTSNIYRYKHRNLKLNVPGFPWDVRGTPTTRASTATARAFPIGKRITHFK